MSDTIFNLIVTGQIPGTNYTISFYEFLIGLMVITIVYLVHKLRENEEKIYDIYYSPNVQMSETADVK